jgi:hypothetical protein
MEGDEIEYEVVHLEKQPKDLPMYFRALDGKWRYDPLVAFTKKAR